MSAQRAANHMRMQAALLAGKLAKPRHGLVTDYDPAIYSVKVTIQPEGFETGWLPITTAMAGNGFGLYFGPANGDVAILHFQEGDREIGFCTGFLPNEVEVPLPVPAGEIWAVHKTGQFVKFTNDGKLSLNDAHGASIVLDGAGNIASAGAWKHTGTLEVTDAVTLDSTLAVSGKTTAAEIDSSGPIKVGGVTVTVP